MYSARKSEALRVGNLLVNQREMDRLLITETRDFNDRDAWLDDRVIDEFLLCAVSSTGKHVSSFSTFALPTMSRIAKTRALGTYLRQRYDVPLFMKRPPGWSHFILKPTPAQIIGFCSSYPMNLSAFCSWTLSEERTPQRKHRPTFSP